MTAPGLGLQYAPVGYNGGRDGYCDDINSDRFLEAVKRENTRAFKVMWYGIFTNPINTLAAVIVFLIPILIVCVGIYGPTLIVSSGPVVSNEIVMAVPSIEVDTVVVPQNFAAGPQYLPQPIFAPPPPNIAAQVTAESISCIRLVNSCSSASKWAIASNLPGFPLGFNYARAPDCEAQCVPSSTALAFSGVCECTRLPSNYVFP